MSAQTDFACESSILHATLSISERQPSTPKIDHLRLCEALPELELSEMDELPSIDDFELGCMEFRKHEYEHILDQTQDTLNTSPLKMRNSTSQKCIKISPFLASHKRYRIMSEICPQNVSGNSIFRFLKSKKSTTRNHDNFN